MSLVDVAIIVFIFNIPFGYWRINTKKFSRQWILSVHIPVPFVISLRIFAGLGWRFITFPILVGAFFLGQFLGGRLHLFFEKKIKEPITSCLVMDIIKITNVPKSKNN